MTKEAQPQSPQKEFRQETDAKRFGKLIDRFRGTVSKPFINNRDGVYGIEDYEEFDVVLQQLSREDCILLIREAAKRNEGLNLCSITYLRIVAMAVVQKELLPEVGVRDGSTR